MELDKWVSEQLSQCLDFPVPEELVEYVLSLENVNELEEYLKNLLNTDIPRHQEFVTLLMRKKKQQSPSGDNNSNKPKRKYKPLATSPEKTKDDNASDGAGKKKTKFVNLYSQDGQNKDTILLKGRLRCDCEARKHKLINNCIKCGRIVCQQEGSGPCLFCGNLVVSKEEQAIINSKSKKSATLLNRLMEQKRPEGWEAAVLHRNRLLDYDRTSERRTRVTDDDSDYFNSGSVWLSKTERTKLEKYEQSLQEKKHSSRASKTYTIDFAGREIIPENNVVEVDENIIKEISGTSKSDNYNSSNEDSNLRQGESGMNIHPGYTGPLFQAIASPHGVANVKNHPFYKLLHNDFERLKVQDPHLRMMSDEGVCLSMHQPWASLLVAGIKIHEGRTWTTNHRGRLYIAATAQKPDDDLIKSMEEQYRILYPDKELVFPKHYSTACLLGCITLEDVLSQEEYRRQYPDGESESPYVFICSNPVELDLKFPIKGQHKIYRLERHIHDAAKKAAMKFL